VQVGFVLLCFCFAGELTSGRPFGQALASFLAVFWGSRVLLQLFYYDRELRRAYRLFDVLFLAADGFLAAVFALVLLPVLTENCPNSLIDNSIDTLACVQASGFSSMVAPPS